MPQVTKINSQPFDFLTAGTASNAGAASTLQQIANDGTKLVMGYDTVNQGLLVAYNGTVTEYGIQYEYSYDFSRDGGAVSTITLKGPQLPVGFRILNAVWCPRVLFTSGGAAQISIGTATGSATDLVAAAVLGTNGTVGPKQGVPDWATLGDSIRITTATTPVIAITVSPLTGGSGKLILNGFMDVQDSAS